MTIGAGGRNKFMIGDVFHVQITVNYLVISISKKHQQNAVE